MPLGKEIIEILPHIDAEPVRKLSVPMITVAGNQDIAVGFGREDQRHLVSYKDKKPEELRELLNTAAEFLSDDDRWFAVGVIAKALFQVPEGKLSHFEFWLTLRENTGAAVFKTPSATNKYPLDAVVLRPRSRHTSRCDRREQHELPVRIFPSKRSVRSNASTLQGCAVVCIKSPGCGRTTRSAGTTSRFLEENESVVLTCPWKVTRATFAPRSRQDRP